MKLAILFAVFLTVSQISADTPGFAIDREYKYSYGARAATGDPKIKQLSGVGFRGNVILQNQGNYIYLKFEDFEYGQFNERFTDVDLYQELPIQYQPIGGPHTFLKEALSKPIRVTVEKGLVKNFDVYPEDPEWSVNMKRSILSLFQLNLDGVNRIRYGKSNYMKQEENLDFFRVMEDGVRGECESIYEIAHHPYHHHYDVSVVNVTKHRRYDHCTHRPYSVFTSHMGYKCKECDALNLDPLTSYSKTEYQLRGNRHFYTIERIYNDGKFHFTPFTRNSKTIMSAVNQTLFLTNSWPIKTPIAFPEKFLTYTSLTYNGTDESHYKPTEVNLDVPNPPGYHFVEPKSFDFKTPLGKLLPELATTFTLTDDLVEKKLPEKFINLVKIVSLLTFDDLKQVHDTYLNYEYNTASVEKQREKKVFWDALITAGTNPAVKFVFYALEKGFIRPEPAAKYLDALAYHVKEPSEKLVEYVYTQIKTIEKTKKELYQTLWLAFGTLVHRGCEKVSGWHDSGFHHTHHHVDLIRSETCLRYAKDVYEMLTQTTTNYEEILYVKVLGNMALKETLRYLRPILTGEEHYTEIVRLQAFWASMKYTQTMREEVLAIVIPVLNNYTEPHAIRIAAFEVVMYTEPTYTGLKAIANRIREEPDRQVASYIYSFFVAMANSSNPCHINLKKDSRRILTTLRPVFYGYHYSRMALFNYFNDKYAFGGQTLVSYTGSNESFIPDSVYVEQVGQILGYNFDYFSVDVETRGFAKFYEKIFGGDGIFDPRDENKSILNMFRRHPRDVNTVQKELDEINNAVPVVPREHEPTEALIAFTAFDQEFKFFYFHEKNIPSLKENGYLYLPKDLPQMFSNGYKLNMQKYLMVADVMYSVPTELGFPLKFSVKAPAFMRLSGDIKLKVEPGFFPEDRNYKKASSIKIETDLKPVMHVQAFTSVTMKTPIFTDYGYGINHEFIVKFPVKVNMDYDVKEKKFHINYTPSQTKYKMIHYSNQPYTFINNKLNRVPLSQEKTILPIHYVQHPSEYDVQFGEKHFGAGLRVFRRSERTWTNWGSYYKTLTSFFTKKGRNFESNPYPYNIVHRVVDGLMSIRDYLRFYPSMTPYLFKLYYTPSAENPTTDYDFTVDFVNYLKTSTGMYQEDLTTPEKIIPLNPTFRKVYGMHIDLIANGAVTRKYHIDYNMSYPSIGGMPKKLSIDYRRSPVPNYDPEPFQICYRASLKTPTVNQFLALDKTTEQKAEIDYTLTFGKDCETDKKITVKAVLEKSNMQKEHDSDPTQCPMFLECDKLMKKGSYLNVPCFEYYSNFYTMRKYTVDIDYQNIPTYITKTVVHLTKWMKSYFYTNLHDFVVEPSNPEGHIKIVANYSLGFPAKMDLTVRRPGATSYYKDLFYPYYQPLYSHFNLRRSPKHLALDHLFQWNWEPTCMLVKNQVWTYDHVSYYLPEATSNCYKVFSKDCSQENLYTVLVKKTDNDMYTKAIKIFTTNHKIEILPVGGVLTVRVDDQKRAITPDSLFVLRNVEKSPRPVIKIYHVFNGYIVKLPVVGIKIFFDGKTVTQIISNTFRGHACGLCGDANGESEYEFTGPKGCVYHDAKPFVYSYTVPEGTCTIPTTETKDCFYPHAPKHTNKCALTYRNKVIHDVSVDGKGKQASNVCFSTKPIAECPSGCKVTYHIKNRVGFHCLNTRDDYTSVLIRESKVRELTELKNKSEDYYDVVQYADHCSKP